MKLRLMLFAAALSGCAGDLDSGSGDYSSDGDDASDDAIVSPDAASQCFTSSECPTGYICNDFNRCEYVSTPIGDDGGIPPPPEVEIVLSQPVSSERFVYVAMTEQDELARIDGQTGAVRSTAVGDAPKVAQAIPHSDGALVLDSVNGTATIVRPNGEEDLVKVLPTLRNLNRLDIDPSGRYAVVWFDLTKAIADGGIDGIGSFQDVTVIALAPGVERAVNLTVGFRPRSIAFDALGTRGYVITEDGVSVIDLGIAVTQGPTIVPPIPVADAGTPTNQLEVGIVSTGSYAVVRQTSMNSLRLVGLTTPERGQIWELPLSSPATDVDFAPNGSRVYVIQREAQQMSIIDVPADFLNPAGVQTLDLAGAALGSLQLSADGKRALMFTNATLDERITLVKLDQPTVTATTWPLKKAVRAVGISPTGTTAIVIHAKAPGDPDTATNVDDFIDKSYGYSMLDLATGFAKLEVTPVDPGAHVYAPDGTKAYIALDGGDLPTDIRALQIVDTRTGVVIVKPLGSPPEMAGILPGAGTGEAFVLQRHPLGRVTFVNLLTDAFRTVTGFDLNGDIVN
jgi:DNA-binding beta-propeller fold protein YncE